MSDPVLSSQTPAQVLTHSAACYPDHDALYIPASACGTLRRRSHCIDLPGPENSRGCANRHLGSHGYHRSSRTGVENRPAFLSIGWRSMHWVLALFHSTMKCPTKSSPTISSTVKHRPLSYLGEHYDRLVGICQSMRTKVTVVADDGVAEYSFGTPRNPIAADPARECALLYTSGSTGKPKACVLSNDYFIQQGLWYRALDGHISLREGQSGYSHRCP